jgi:hypothetical protein
MRKAVRIGSTSLHCTEYRPTGLNVVSDRSEVSLLWTQYLYNLFGVLPNRSFHEIFHIVSVRDFQDSSLFGHFPPVSDFYLCSLEVKYESSKVKVSKYFLDFGHRNRLFWWLSKRYRWSPSCNIPNVHSQSKVIAYASIYTIIAI